MLRSLLASIFSSIVRIRLGLYKSGLKKIRRLDKPVISIGNITLGGTGKTPFTIYLCRILAEKGFSPAVLSRGYRGTAEKRNLIISNGEDILCGPEVSGDEPRLIAESLPGVPVAVGGRRHASGLLVLKNPSLNSNIFVLDDGFQHVQLHRDLNLVLIDATSPFGGGKVLPAGILREPLSSLRRANAIIVTRSHLAEDRKEKIRRDLEKYTPAAPVFFYSHRLRGFKPLGGQKTDTVTAGQEIAPLPGKKAFVLAAIGNPLQFIKDLEQMELGIAGQALMRDHHAYCASDLARIRDEFSSSGAEFIVTTEKDAVRLRHLDIDELPIFAAVQDIYSEEEHLFQEWLDRQLQIISQ